MSKIYDRLLNCNPERAIEMGTICENCLLPIEEDRRPPAEDFRVKIGRTKRLCPKCTAIEDEPGCENVGERKCQFWCASLHKPHKGPCFEMYSHRDTCPGAPDCSHDEGEQEVSELWKEIDQLATDIDALKRLQTNLERRFPTSGLGPRGRMRKARDER